MAGVPPLSERSFPPQEGYKALEEMNKKLPYFDFLRQGLDATPEAIRDRNWVVGCILDEEERVCMT